VQSQFHLLREIAFANSVFSMAHGAVTSIQLLYFRYPFRSGLELSFAEDRQESGPVLARSIALDFVVQSWH
jgi:hypothetical protein